MILKVLFKLFLLKKDLESFFFFKLYNIVLVLPNIEMNPPQVYMCSPPWTLLPPHTIPLGRPSAPAPSIQHHAWNLDWWLISYMILYVFQCHSPKSSHPLPLPQSPKDCSIHQCLFCCLVYRVIVTIFLNSIYMDVRAILLWHLSPHWSPGLIRLIWLARRVSPSSLTTPCASLSKLRARLKRMTIPDRGGPVFCQGYMSSCAPLLEPPNKLSRSQRDLSGFEIAQLKFHHLH